MVRVECGESDRAQKLSHDEPTAISNGRGLKNPLNTHSEYALMRKPRSCVGLCSEIYRGIVAWSAPTPIPASSLAPSQSVQLLVTDSVIMDCTVQNGNRHKCGPTQQIMNQTTQRAIFRPYRSDTNCMRTCPTN